MLLHLMGQTALVIPRTEGDPDVYGGQRPTWDEDDGVEFPCRLEPTKATEEEINRDTRVTLFKLFLPATAAGVITGTSRVKVDGVTYEIRGEPLTYIRRSQTDHVEATARRILG